MHKKKKKNPRVVKKKREKKKRVKDAQSETKKVNETCINILYLTREIIPEN